MQGLRFVQNLGLCTADNLSAGMIISTINIAIVTATGLVTGLAAVIYY